MNAANPMNEPKPSATNKTCDVIVFGDLFVDLVMTGFPRLPQLGEEGLASALRREVGGGAAITGCGLGVLGASTQVMGVVGQDEVEWFRRKLESKGVRSEALVAHPSEPTAITVAVSTKDDRIFYTYSAANSYLEQILRNNGFRSQLAQARHVHLAYLAPPRQLGELASWLHAQGCSISVDVGWNEAWLTDPAALDALKAVDWFFPNEREAACMSGQPVSASGAERVLGWFANQGLNGVALKLGAGGSAALSRGEFVLRPPFGPVAAIDTTGAGDCFDAGFLFAWLQGKPVGECLAWGNVCGAYSTRCAGGIEGFPSRLEVEAALSSS